MEGAPPGQGPKPEVLELCSCQTASSQTELQSLASRTQGRQFWKPLRAAACERSEMKPPCLFPQDRFLSQLLPWPGTRVYCVHRKSEFSSVEKR